MKTLMPVILFLLAGCVTTSAVTPYGKDTYILNTSDTWGAAGSSELRVRAAKEAGAHCEKLGKSFSVESSTERGAQWWTSTHSAIVFKCV